MSGDDWPDAARNSAGSYAAAIDAIRREGVKAGRFLPRPGHADEIQASPMVEDVRQVGPCTLYLGDSTRIVALLAGEGPAWVDACVTDPPYELGFMGKRWDSSGVAADWRTWGGVRIALKPGAHLVAFAGSRTYHRITQAIEDAGLEVRDQLMWIYGGGFPKSLDVAKELDKRGGVWRGRAGEALPGDPKDVMFRGYKRSPKGKAVFDDAKRWDGWGTALKPAHEPVCFARKPLAEQTVAANVLRWATGAINVDAARIGYRDGNDLAAAAAAAAAAKAERDEPGRPRWAGGGGRGFNDPEGSLAAWQDKSEQGRWPANVLTDGSLEVLEAFPPSARDAIRFFYAAKADKSEREAGLDRSLAIAKRADPGAGDGERAVAKRVNHHPTVKPVDLMRWLCRLVTPPGGVVLDPFMGSGTTGVAAVKLSRKFTGIEREEKYFDIACRRIEEAYKQPDLFVEAEKKPTAEQLSLLTEAA